MRCAGKLLMQCRSSRCLIFPSEERLLLKMSCVAAADGARMKLSVGEEKLRLVFQ